MNSYEAYERMTEISKEIKSLVREAKKITKEFASDSYDHFDAYVFGQIEEHLEKGNPYNRDFNDICNAIDEDNEDDFEDEDDEDEEDVENRSSCKY